MLWNAVSTLVESRADVSMKESWLDSAKDFASSVGTALKWRRSDLLPTNMITISEKKYQMSVFIKRKVFMTCKNKKSQQPENYSPINNYIANISLYALSWPKFNFGCYLTFEIIFKLYFNGKTNKIFLGCWIFFTCDKLSHKLC